MLLGMFKICWSIFITGEYFPTSGCLFQWPADRLQLEPMDLIQQRPRVVDSWPPPDAPWALTGAASERCRRANLLLALSEAWRGWSSENGYSSWIG